MGYIKTIFFLIITVRCFAVTPAERWLDDFDRAQEMARAENRPLLIAFLGPDWCPCSDKLEEEVLTRAPFLTALKDQVIFLRVDIAEDYDQIESAANRLKEQYRIDTCPSLVLVEPNGHEIAKLDSLPFEGKELACSITGMLSDYYLVEDLTEKKQLNGLAINEIKSLYAKAGKFADATFKNALLEEGLKVDQGPYFLIEQYSRFLSEEGIQSRKSKVLRNKIIARDIDNEKGYRRQLALMDFEALATLNKRARTVIKPLTEYLQKFGGKDTENAWEIEMKISRYLFSQDQIEEALKHASASLKIAPTSAHSEVAKSVEYLQTLL